MLLRRLTVALERLAAVAVCALATHALVYRTLWPADGIHGYFGWYEPVVAVLSIAALAGLSAFVAFAWLARRSGRPLRRAVWMDSPGSALESARSLGASSLAFLLIQESVERSVAAGHPAFQVFTPSEWLMLLAGVAATSVLLVLGMHLARAVVTRALGASPARRMRREVARGWSLVTCTPRRPRPLAERFALRAPPLS